MDDTYCEKRSTIVVDLVPSELFQISNIVKMTTFEVISLRLSLNHTKLLDYCERASQVKDLVKTNGEVRHPDNWGPGCSNGTVFLSKANRRDHF